MSFKRELKFAVDEISKITTEDWRKSLNEAFLSTILKTPVDTGAARNSWYTNLGATNNGEGARGDDRGGSGSIKQMQAEVSKAELGGRVLLYNNLPYIDRDWETMSF